MAPQWLTIVSKFGDHLPFYRQAEIFRRQGIDLDRSTLGNWVGRAFWGLTRPHWGHGPPQLHLMPVINHMRAHLRAADRIFVDETRAPVLDPGRKATKSGFFWAVVSDDRGHGGADPPIVLFHYASGRGKAHPLNFLAGYQGRFLQCDAYQSYNAMTDITRDNGPWQLVYCWTHVRRRFVKRFESDGSPIAEEMLRQITLLYQIEKSVRGKDAAVRLAARREHSAPIIAALKHGRMREIGMVIREWAELDHVPFMAQAERRCQAGRGGCSAGGRQDRGQSESTRATVTGCRCARVIVDDYGCRAGGGLSKR